MSSGIFISYRRSGGLETARNLRDRLSSLNYKVFFDLTSMREGKFNRQIFDEIAQADDFILILSEGSLDRCVEEQDWLRLEIQRALLLHKNIIPVWKPAFQGFPPSLPQDIADVKLYDSVKLSEDYYDAFFQKVLVRLKSQRTNNVIDNDPKYTVAVGQDSRFITFTEWLDKKRRFKFLQLYSWLVVIQLVVFGGIFIGEGMYYSHGDISTETVGGVICILFSFLFIYTARFVGRLKKKFSSDFSEVERSRKALKVVRNTKGEWGLIRVGFSTIKILLPCKYNNIQRIDQNNYVLVTSAGKALYNRKRQCIVGQGPYETIKKTKYKIECVGINKIDMFSLDGYQRYD